MDNDGVLLPGLAPPPLAQPPLVQPPPAQPQPPQHPPHVAEISLATDASDHHIGGVLQQKEGGAWRPLAFFSRKLSDMQIKYSVTEMELLSIIKSLKKFKGML